MKHIIVFGASGDIGKYFIKYLIKHNKNYNIIATGTRDTDFFNKLNLTYIKININNKNDFFKLPQKDVYAIVDLAGIMPARMKGYNPYKYIETNIIGTLNILEYSRYVNIDRFLYSQSFGDIKEHAEKNILLKRDLSRNFKYNNDHTVYVMSKNFAVDLIENYHQMYNIKNFIFRLPTIYLFSPIDYYYVNGLIHKISYRVLIDNAINGKPIEVWGDPNRKKDMVYVKDFCQMLYKALFINRNTGYYNVGTGVGTSLLEQISGIINVFCSASNKSKMIMCPEKNNAPQYIMDISDAKKELNYIPKYDYITMLNDIKQEMYSYEKTKTFGDYYEK